MKWFWRGDHAQVDMYMGIGLGAVETVGRSTELRSTVSRGLFLRRALDMALTCRGVVNTRPLLVGGARAGEGEDGEEPGLRPLLDGALGEGATLGGDPGPPHSCAWEPRHDICPKLTAP